MSKAWTLWEEYGFILSGFMSSTGVQSELGCSSTEVPVVRLASDNREPLIITSPSLEVI